MIKKNRLGQKMAGRVKLESGCSEDVKSSEAKTMVNQVMGLNVKLKDYCYRPARAGWACIQILTSRIEHKIKEEQVCVM